MQLSVDDLPTLWSDVLRHKKLLIVCGPDADSLCALESLTTLLKRDQKEFVYSLGGDLNVSAHLRDKNITGMFLLNCVYSLGDNMENVLLKMIPKQIDAVYVFDAYRPLPRSSLFGFVDKDDDDDDDDDLEFKKKQKVADCFAFYTPCGDKKKKENDTKDMKRSMDPPTIIDHQDFNGQASILFPCAYMMLDLSFAVENVDMNDQYMLWRAIVGTTHYYLHDRMERDRYGQLAQEFQSHMSRLVSCSQQEKEVGKHENTMLDDGELPPSLSVAPNKTGTLHSSTHCRTVFQRHCSLWKSLSYSPLIHSRWNEYDRKEMLAHLGIPLQTAQQQPMQEIAIKKTVGLGMFSNPDPFVNAVNTFCSALNDYNYLRTVVYHVLTDDSDDNKSYLKAIQEHRPEILHSNVAPIDRGALFYESFHINVTANTLVDAADLVYIIDVLFHDDRLEDAVDLLASVALKSDVVFKKHLSYALRIYDCVSQTALRLSKLQHKQTRDRKRSITTEEIHMTDIKDMNYCLLATFLVDYLYCQATLTKYRHHRFRVLLCVLQSDNRYTVVYQNSYPLHLIASEGRFQLTKKDVRTEWPEIEWSVFPFLPSHRECFYIGNVDQHMMKEFIQQFYVER